MAIENKVILRGQIEKINTHKEELMIRVYLKRKFVSGENKIDHDIVKVYVRNPQMVKYVNSMHPIKGDEIKIKGVYTTIPNIRKKVCKCGETVTYDSVLSIIHPTFLEIFPCSPIKEETVELSLTETLGGTKLLLDALNKKKKNEGIIIGCSNVKKNESTSSYECKIRTRKPAPLGSIKDIEKIGNYVIVMGNLVNDPDFNNIKGEDKRSVCEYKLHIDRKLFIPEEDSITYDRPYIKSLGLQAIKDRDTLKKGSLVIMDGFLQTRNDYEVNVPCENCGESVAFKNSAMEVIPYHMEALRNLKEQEEDMSGRNIIEKENNDLTYANLVMLQGRINEIKVKYNAEKEPVYAMLSVYTTRRIVTAMGNKGASRSYDMINVFITNKNIIKAIEDQTPVHGDTVEVIGELCNAKKSIKRKCPSCNKENIFEIYCTTVHPTWVRIIPNIKPVYETISLDPIEALDIQNLQKILNSKKINDGEVKKIISKTKNDQTNMYEYKVLVRKADKLKNLKEISEVSNLVYCKATLDEDPILYGKGANAVCEYKVTIHRAMELNENDNKEDHIYIVSFGDNAVDDEAALHAGSEIFVEGYLQARKMIDTKRINNDYYSSEICIECGEEMYLKNYEMVISAYYTEYIDNFENLERKDEIPEDDQYIDDELDEDIDDIDNSEE